MDTKILANSLFEKNTKDFLSTEVDGEMVLMNTNNGRYLGLTAVTTDIWKHLDDNITFDNLIKRLLEEYDVSEQKCKKETSDLLNTLIQIKLLKLIDGKD